MITVVLNVKYFNGETCEGVEYDTVRYAADMTDAQQTANEMVDEAECLAFEGGGMMPGTFWYEYYFEMSESEAQKMGITDYEYV